MGAYLVRRLALMLLTLFGISVLIFVLLRIVRETSPTSSSTPPGS
jgi:ABC-type dipeptide/oligopeptide/nickel transport system permease component